MHRNEQVNHGPAIEFFISQFNGSEYLERTIAAIRRFHKDARITIASSDQCQERQRVREIVAQFNAVQVVVKHGHENAIRAIVRNFDSDVFHCIIDQDCELLYGLSDIAEEMERKKVMWYAPEDRMILFGEARKVCSVPYVRNTPGVGHISLVLIAPTCDGTDDLFEQTTYIDYPRFHHQREFYHPFFLARHRAGKFFGTLYSGVGTTFIYYWRFRPIALHHWFSSRYFQREGRAESVDNKLWGMYDLNLITGPRDVKLPPFGGLRAYAALKYSTTLCRFARACHSTKQALKHLLEKE
jgi:hypothetical protein